MSHSSSEGRAAAEAAAAEAEADLELFLVSLRLAHRQPKGCGRVLCASERDFVRNVIEKMASAFYEHGQLSKSIVNFMFPIW